ncbi:MAG: glycosyltransferase [Candidatus Competibacter sp.]
MRVFHIITGLAQGGAEAVLYRLVSATSPETKSTVVSLTDKGVYADKLRECGAEVETLNMPRGRLTLGGIRALKQLIGKTQPDVVQTWMYHADLIGGLVARWSGIRPVIWGIRHANLDADKNSLSTRAAVQACAALANRIPVAIICCSEQAARAHQAKGYPAHKFTIIPNGYDLNRFTIDEASRIRIRQEWNIASHEILLGLVARWHQQKDHANLIQALALLAQKGIEFRCVLVGTGMDKGNELLCALIHQFGLEAQIILTGPRHDIPDIMNALDLHVLSSVGEAFPNTVAEAMACGTSCVVTDVGDAALIVGDTGWVAPPQNAQALANQIEQGLATVKQEGRELRGQYCRSRIMTHFGLEKMVSAYRLVWENAARIDRRSL